MVGIVTDSTANLTKEIIDNYKINVLSAYIIFENEKFKEGEMEHQEFCKRLTSSSKRVVTAPTSAGEFVDIYSKLKDEVDVIFSIHVSSKMSNYYRNAQIAAEMIKSFDKPLEIIAIDSQNVDLALGMIVIEAAKLAKEGKSKEEIKNRIDTIIKNSKGYFYVDTLEYLVKSTRVSRVKGLLGSFLNMKPILSIENGEVILKDKAIGKENCLGKIIKLMENDIKPNSKIKLGIVNSLLEKDADALLKTIKTKFNCVEIFKNNTSQSVVINAGPNNLGIFFYEV